MMPRTTGFSYHDAAAVLTSMHAKERVIGPILRDELGLIVRLSMGIDTDKFSTFSCEVGRSGSQLDAARAKIAAGFEYAPSARVGLASEGSFGQHPYVPFLVIGRELVLMVDRESGLQLTGYDASEETNFGQRVVRNLESAFACGQGVGFPDHGLIVMTVETSSPRLT